MMHSRIDEHWMGLALELAILGQGSVEPNPMVGCVIVRDNRLIGRGHHRTFGGPHAEMEALRDCEESPQGATAYISLEPCCHTGKTPPCTDSLIQAGIRRVVAAMTDPFPQVAGRGLAQLREAGLEVSVGTLESRARYLNAPFIKRTTTGFPWVIAKWAMTLDGKIATRTGDSRWISGKESLRLVHEIRGRVDGIIVGSGTAVADDPLLTARPPEIRKRVATRIVIDSSLILPVDSQLVRTAGDVPVLIATCADAPDSQKKMFRDLGCDVLESTEKNHAARMKDLLRKLAARGMTNLLVEGGGRLLGLLFDQELVDEVHAFVAPMIAGGERGFFPVGGEGIEAIASARRLDHVAIRTVENDMYLSGRIARKTKG
jgi:diaminohydroxyphosphoribosylaminopyrimidine deaminase / 5-amino-6-(5-phosphoribosylamino)uracil reductase